MKEVIVKRLRQEFRKECFRFNCEPWRFLTLQWSGKLPEEENKTWSPPLPAVLHATLYRAFMMLYTIAWLVVDVVINVDPYYLTFLTHWGQFVMVLYFVFSFFIVYMEFAGRITSEEPTDNSRPTGNPTSLRWYHLITWILFNIYVTVAYIITVSYWVGVVFDLIAPAKSVASANFHVHVINSILATIELAVGNLPVRILHCYCPIIFGLIYLFFTLIIHWSGELSAIYDVLDWMGGPGMAAGYGLGILFIAVPLFHTVTTWGITELRLYVYKNRAKLKACCLRERNSDYDVRNRDVEHNLTNGSRNERYVSDDVMNAVVENVTSNDGHSSNEEEDTRL